MATLRLKVATPHDRPAGETPIGVGIDVVRVTDVSDALQRFGDRYIERVFTPREAAYCRNGTEAVAAARFAARFAAKEAVIKALAPAGARTDWRAIEIWRQKSGRCGVTLHGDARTLATRRGITRLELSMSHEDDTAAAIVIAIGARRRARGIRHA